MRISDIQERILSFYQTFSIRSFPIDYFTVVEQLGFRMKAYSELSEKKAAACMELSPDACLLKDTLYYESRRPKGRVRFTIMHEVGHIVLETTSEKDADAFASHSLAPRMAIHYSGCKNASDVMRHFGLSEEAADYAFNDYRNWHRTAVYKMSPIDKKIYAYFYNREAEGFVFSIHPCAYCGRLIYNRPHIDTCPMCYSRIHAAPPRSYLYSNPLSAESRALGSL